MQELVLFQTGNMEFALKRDCIDNIRPIPEGCLGTRRSRQQTIELEDGLNLLIDLSSGVNQGTVPPPVSDAKMITVKGSPSYALLADHIKEALEADEKELDRLPPVFAGTAGACFPNVLQQKDQLVLVVDTQAVAEFEIDFDTAPDIWFSRQSDIENHRETPIIESEPPLPRASPPLVSNHLEAKVGQILQEIIGQRVQKKVAETMAQTLATAFW